MDKENTVHIYNGMLFNHKKEQNNVNQLYFIKKIILLLCDVWMWSIIISYCMLRHNACCRENCFGIQCRTNSSFFCKVRNQFDPMCFFVFINLFI